MTTVYGDTASAVLFIEALTGNANTIMDFRCIHDTNKGVPAIPFTGTFAQCEPMLRQYNEVGYGIFYIVNQSDGSERKLRENISAIRAHFIDLDGNDQGMRAALGWYIPPQLYVNTSPGKFHIYWRVLPYACGADFFEDVQRRLVTLFQSDPTCIDPSRVLRLPGFMHRKGEPFAVTWHQHATTTPYAPSLLASALAQIPPSGSVSSGDRRELGDPKLAAPSLEWLMYGLSQIDPNELDRGEWVSLIAAFKQAGWSLTDEGTLYNIFSQWCARYVTNDPAENLKQWNSIRNTEKGWPGIVKRANLLPQLLLRGDNVQIAAGNTNDGSAALTASGDFLDAGAQVSYFQGCTLVASEGRIRTAKGYHFDQNRFNSFYGGPRFVYTLDGKTTDEAWKAVTRNQWWKIPVADRARFLPMFEPNTVVTDQFGRTSINSYIKPRIEHEAGDISPFLDHVAKMLPIVRDREIVFDFMTWQVQHVGQKIPWAVLLQSAEGAGKTAFQTVMSHALGSDYVYVPKAEQLADSGGKFNAWMENKLLIVVNEIRVGERYQLMEVLKPLITDVEIEIEGKGADQRKGDNPANWFMFSNYRDALLVNADSRRYAINYSALQTHRQILQAGFDNDYFTKFYDWLRGPGVRYITHWLLQRQLSSAFTYARAPDTSSTKAAVQMSKPAIRLLIESAIDANEPGFRNGWISTKAVSKLAIEADIRLETRSMAKIIEGMGYNLVGKLWAGNERGTTLWHINPSVSTSYTYNTDQFL